MKLIPLLLLAATLGLPSATAEVQAPSGALPVIQKLQLVFSMVSHHCHIPERVSFYNTYGTPAGNQNYASPHLVCDPLVTLYNPHPDPITLYGVRVRIWDPPVGFRFKKNGVYLRTDYQAGQFLGLARFLYANQSNSSARKSITLYLSEPNTSGAPGLPITLQPGETRTYSPWVESYWTWSLEVAGGYSMRSFFDVIPSVDLTNIDGRTSNVFGAEAVPGPNYRAGFQWDHLATVPRPPGTRYDFEVARNWDPGWVAIKLEDTVTVESRALRTLSLGGALAVEPDFRVSLLAARYFDPSNDIYQDFSFSADSIVQPQTGTSTQPSLSRTLSAGAILQSPTDVTLGGKTPFAALTVMAKRESLTSGALEEVGYMDGESHYDVQFDALDDFEAVQDLGDEHLHVPPVATPRYLGTHLTDSGVFRLAVASNSGVSGWNMVGGTSPGSLSDDLQGQFTVVPLPSSPTGAQCELISLDTSLLGPRYFMRLEEPGP